MQTVTSNSWHLHKSSLLSPSMADSLPDRFSVIVVGTGMVESMVAAAAARAGHSVLHLDCAKYYGGEWASFTWDGLMTWTRDTDQDADHCPSSDSKKEDVSQSEKEGETLVNLMSMRTIENLRQTWNNEKKKDDVDADSDGANGKLNTGHWDQEEILKQSRKFNIDLSPRLLYSRGDMVELLISSNISRYTEFKSVTRVLTSIDGRLEQVPSSRSDVFNTKQISVVEKRILMKFLTARMQETEEAATDPDATDKTFGEFLKQQKLTPNLLHYVCHSIAMVSPTESVTKGLSAVKKFLSSLGRFGPTPFLWSMYGTGELPQAFCRLCAVFGGIYYLGKTVDKIVMEDGKVTGVMMEDKRIACDHLVLPANFKPAFAESLSPGRDNVMSRTVMVSSSSLLPSDTEQVTFLSLPQETGSGPIHVIEVGAGAAACPRGLQLLHLTGPGDLDLEMTARVRGLVSEESLIYSLSWTQTRAGWRAEAGSGLWQAPGPGPELDFDLAIEQARKIYSGMFPEDEFLPRAPDPEEIIFGDEEPTQENDEDSAAAVTDVENENEDCKTSTKNNEEFSKNVEKEK